MKTIAARFFAPALTTLAVALTFGAAAAPAQTVRGNLPFGFTVNHKNMAAGNYTIAPINRFDTAEPLVLHNVTDRTSVIAGVSARIAVKAGDRPHVEFLCGAENCRLYRVYSVNAAWQIVQPGRTKAEAERVATVYLTTESAH